MVKTYLEGTFHTQRGHGSNVGHVSGSFGELLLEICVD